ncbi:MAG: hypothetical protein ACJ796_16685 [Gemmatimonadaceae bacterium]
MAADTYRWFRTGPLPTGVAGPNAFAGCLDVALEICMDMGLCAVALMGCTLLAVVGWALTLFYRQRAIRYRAAFDRAFAIARRAYNFTEEETIELTKLFGEPIDGQQEHGNR